MPAPARVQHRKSPADSLTLPRADRVNVFRAAMEEIVVHYSLEYYNVGLFPEADKANLLENLIVTNWPNELLKKYASTDMFRESSIVEGLKNTILPISSGNLLFARAREEGVKSELLGIFYDVGFRRTVGLSLHDANRRQYLIMLSGGHEVTSFGEISGLIYDTMKALDAFCAAGAKQPQSGLTSREVECLRWSAAGKSSEEIAIIIGISAHTVNTYLKTAMRKLDAVSRMQAVAAACRLRLI